MSRTTSHLGGFEIGLVVATFLYGVCTVQTTLYFARFPKDPLITRVLVMILWPLQGVQIVLMCGKFYRDVCAPITLELPDELWSDKIWQALGIVISGLVQAFYARRIYRLCRNLSLMITLHFLILLKLVIGFTYIFQADESVTLIMGKEKWLAILLMVDDSVVDQYIALSMTYTLVKRRTRFASTNTIINRLVVYAVGMGLLTSVLPLVAVISFIMRGYNWIFMMLNSTFSCVYFFAMLANLHTRSTLKKFMGCAEDVPIPLTTIEVCASAARCSNDATPGEVRDGDSDCKNSSPTSDDDIS